jgi:hypothetical protein
VKVRGGEAHPKVSEEGTKRRGDEGSKNGEEELTGLEMR